MANTTTVARGGGSSAPGRRRKRPGGPARPSGLPSWAVPYVLLVPGLLVIAGLLLYPMVQLVIISFQKFGIAQQRGRPADWVGWANFEKILSTELFWTSLRNTVVFAVVAVTLTLVVGTAVGVLLHKLGKKMSLFVVIGCMFAWAIPPVAQAAIWRSLFDADSGIVNWALNLLPDWLSQALFGRADWTGEPWLNDAFTVYVVLVFCVVWAGFPFIAVSVLAGLKGIPNELYEAAKVDGSGAWRTFRKITLPLLKPVFAVLTVLSIIWDFKVYTQLHILLNGPTNREAFNLSMYAVAEAFKPPPKMGTGAAISIVLTIILLIITVFYVRQIVKQEEM
ncbi:carbohydrate ABC transporter permease [Nonomuraea africana]|uniref:N,N'-diacetylchitobiose transport system permease protein n=1 Tax=Nonomuraea africana TaxID=46171 RepID=A0ABR9KKC1_9ACTN|nr:sugar ABC transporter permease [Nonomuraea africana]MBE1562461.1 N,N'-diacetylchitobiose transport system permease protein [Nonomuraea africana]